VTHLRQLMLEELRRRNYAESTIHAYLRTVEHFAGYFHCPPDQLGLEHIRRYQAAMFTRWKLAPNTVLHPSLTYVPHEPATPATTSPRAPARAAPLRLNEPVAPTKPSQLPSAATSRPPISA
jgi:hypothetical protein